MAPSEQQTKQGGVAADSPSGPQNSIKKGFFKEITMILAIDVHYRKEETKAVGVIFSGWRAEQAERFVIKYLEKAEDYIPGEFYRRELPCILKILEDLPPGLVTCVVVDGFVYLDDDMRPGLGAHLYERLNEQIPVIGVAKSSFASLDKCCRKVYRGNSKNPLYITSAGISPDDAAKYIAEMAGGYRMPALLQQLDTMTKEK